MKKKQLLLLIPLLTSPMYTNGMEETQKLLEAKKSATSKYNAEKTKELKELISPSGRWIGTDMSEVLIPVWDNDVFSEFWWEPSTGRSWISQGKEKAAMVMELIRQGADPNIKARTEGTVGGWTPLMVVALWGSLGELKELIGRVPSILEKDAGNKTAYDHAASRMTIVGAPTNWDPSKRGPKEKERLRLLSKESLRGAFGREARRLKAKITSPLKPR